MKTLVVAFAAGLVLLCVLTVFFESPTAVQSARRYFSDQQISAGLQRSHQYRILFWSQTAITYLLLAGLLFSGLHRSLADWSAARVGGHWLPTLVLSAGVLFLAEWLLTLPTGYVAAVELPRQWGLAAPSYSTWEWLGDRLRATALHAGLGLVLLVGMYALIRYLPVGWWAVAAAGTVAVSVIVAVLWPRVVEPMFHTFTPLSQTQWADRLPRVQRLVARANVPVGEVLVMDASRRSRHTNAYFSGVGATQRIVLYDTLLESHSPEEVDSVLAHEIGHWRHAHILQGLALGAVGAFVGLYLLARLLAAGCSAFGLSGPGDPAGYPLVLLLIFMGGWTSAPVQSAISRHWERQADRTALELTEDPDTFISVERRMAAENISNVAPNPIWSFLFASHPSTVERIEMAEHFRTSQPSPNASSSNKSGSPKPLSGDQP